MKSVFSLTARRTSLPEEAPKVGGRTGELKALFIIGRKCRIARAAARERYLGGRDLPACDPAAVMPRRLRGLDALPAVCATWRVCSGEVDRRWVRRRDDEAGHRHQRDVQKRG